MSARPIATICRSPPDSDPAVWLARSPNRGKRSTTCSKRSGMDFGSRNAPISMFSRTVIDENTFSVCGTNPTPFVTSSCAFSDVMVSPCKVTAPDRIGISPNSDFRKVDLPAPFGPMMPTISWWNSSIEHPLRMFTSGTYPATIASATSRGTSRRCSRAASASEPVMRHPLRARRRHRGSGLDRGEIRGRRRSPPGSTPPGRESPRRSVDPRPSPPPNR